MTLSAVIANVDVIDGTGSAARRAHVGLDGDQIAAISATPLDGGLIDGGRVIDATGLVLSPGFIDMHAHSDLAVLRDADHLAKVAQGVTLEVLGQDGLSYAPAD
ncbi:MAG: N-acyl-D-amino-acid deacylase, partial [Frankiaceae bacterium]|nr:N-acyl-D-amino-acid deacylase [Frankiaceae bacterium]